MSTLADLSQTEPLVPCKHCGQLLPEEDRYCRFCGQDQLDEDPGSAIESTLTEAGYPSPSDVDQILSIVPALADPTHRAALGSVDDFESFEPPRRGRSGSVVISRIAIALAALMLLVLALVVMHDLYRKREADLRLQELTAERDRLRSGAAAGAVSPAPAPAPPVVSTPDPVAPPEMPAAPAAVPPTSADPATASPAAAPADQGNCPEPLAAMSLCPNR
jgi:hypothetical protein